MLDDNIRQKEKVKMKKQIIQTPSRFVFNEIYLKLFKDENNAC